MFPTSPERFYRVYVLVPVVLIGLLVNLLDVKTAVAATIEVSGDITSNTTWTADNVYVVTGDVHVVSGVTLTIQPGAIVKFQNDRSLLVDGKLHAVGTSGQKIYLTSWYDDSVGGDTNNDGTTTTADPNNCGTIWARLRFGSTSDDTSLIEYAVIRYAGDLYQSYGACNNTAAVEIIDASPTIRNSQITLNHSRGLSMQTTLPGTPAQPTITNSTFSSNLGFALSSDVHSHPALSGNTLTSNGGNGMEIQGGTIQADQTWDQTSIVYVVSGDVTVASTYQLTITPGTIVKFQNDRSLLVDGKLHAVGTSGQKIYLTSWYDDSVGGDTNNDGTTTTADPNNCGTIWARLRFGSTSDDTSLIEYAVIRYAGDLYQSYGACNNTAAVEIIDASPTIRNSQITLNHSRGLSMQTTLPGTPAQPTITNSTFSSNLGFALSSDVHSHPALSGNTLTSNGGNGMEIQGGTIQADQTWDQTSIVYVVSGDVTVASTYQLTITPGTIVKFQNDRSLLVDGKLHAVGTSGQKIYLTSWYDDSVGGDTNNDGTTTTADPNNCGTIWARLRFGSTSDDTSLIEYAVIRYAGDLYQSYGACNNTAAVEIIDASPTIRNSQITLNHSRGLSMQTTLPGTPAQPTITNSTFSSNLGFALSSDVHSHPALSGNTLTSNGGNGMEIQGGTIQADQTWDQTSIVYVVSGDVTVASTYQLTITPGTIVKFQNDRSLLVDGKLHAVGTSGQKIYLTSWYDDSVGGDTNNDGTTTTADPNNCGTIWARLRFGSTSDDTSLIEYAVIRYAGDLYQSYGACNNTAAVEIIDASPTIRNSQITLNHSRGLSMQTTLPGTPAQPTITNSTFSSNLGFALSSDVHSHPALSGNTLTSNGGNGMEIQGGTIQADQTWDQTSIVYVVSGDVTVASTYQLTITPGTIVKFQNDRSLLVDGKLHAVGTSGQKIYLTSWYDDSVGGDTNNDGTTTTADPNNCGTIWARLRFGSTSDDTSLIEYAVIRYAGDLYQSYGACNNTAAVEIIDASPTIRNSQITLNHSHGFSIETTMPLSPSQPHFTCLDIENNNGNGMYNKTSTVSVSAINLWWGSTTGPYHVTLNPGGKGNEVSNGISFSPWRTTRCISSGPVDYFVYLPLIRK